MTRTAFTPLLVGGQHEEKHHEQHKQAEAELYLACIAGDADKVAELLRTRPLDAHSATLMLDHGKSEDVACCLLDFGADASKVGVGKNVKKWSPEKLRLMADSGLDVKTQGHKCLQDLVDRPDMLDLLLDLGADINRPFDPHLRNPSSDGTPCEWDRTLGVLNSAAALGDTALFDHLVARGADPARSIALHHACRCRDDDPHRAAAMIAHLVAAHNFDVNADDGCGGLRVFGGAGGHRLDAGPPLVWAVLEFNEAAVHELLRLGADPRSTGAGAPLRLAVGNALFAGFLPAVRPLLAAGADATEGLVAAIGLREPEDEAENLEAVRLCLEYGADPVAAETADAAWVEDERDDEDGYRGMSIQKKQLLETYKFCR